jgi:anaerobic selenocysteine-containing dehydrogenase
MIKITRRTFLKSTAATGAVLAFSGGMNALRPAKAEAAETGTVTYRPSACLGCTTWCAIEAKVQTDGGISRVVDIKGNRKSVSNAGYVCPRGRMNIQQMYDPDRVKVPMMRTNLTKGKFVDPAFVPVSWDDATTAIAEEMLDMRYSPDLTHIKHNGTTSADAFVGATALETAEVWASADLYKGYLVSISSSSQIRMITASTVGGQLTISPALTADVLTGATYDIAPSESHKSLVIRGRYSAVNDVTDAILYSSVPTIFGSPNKVSHSSICAESEKGGWVNVNGAWAYQDYDLDNCKCMILWGVDPTASNRMVPNAIQKIGDRMNNGMKLIVVDPRLSGIASKAHRWLPVKPGTDGALALAIAYWILKNSSTGGGALITLPSFFTDRTSGVTRWWDLELNGNSRTPAWAAGVTGIPELTIKKVACEFAGYNYDSVGNPTTAMSDRTGDDQCKAASWVGPGIAMQPTGVYGAQAAAALNGLVGSFDHIGGVIDKKGSITTGSLLATTSYQDALSAYKGAKMGGAITRSYVRIDPDAPTFDYAASPLVPERPLGLPGIGGSANTVGGTFPTNIVGDALRLGYPYGLGDPAHNCRLIISCMANFPFSCSGAERWESALSKDIFQVICTTHVSEMAMFADLILPSDHTLENYLFTAGQRANLSNIVAMMKPVCWDGTSANKGKLWDTKWGETEVVWELAQKLATIGVGSIVSGWPADYYFTGLRDYVDAYKPGGGSSASDSWEFNRRVQMKYGANTTTYNAATDATWLKLISDNPAQYTEAVNATGVMGTGFGILQSTVERTLGGLYFDANGRGKYWIGTTAFATGSTKVEFSGIPTTPGTRTSLLATALAGHATSHGKTLKEALDACNYDGTAAAMTATNTDAANDIAFMPHWEAPNIEGTGDYKYTFIDYKSRLNQEGRTANCTMYHEFKSCDAGDEKWNDVVKISPIDAKAIGVVDGDTVKITSPTSPTTGIQCKVKIWQGVRTGTVAKCYGQGHWAYGTVASKKFGKEAKGGSNNEILPGEWERLVGGNVRNACTKVKIVKV